MNMDWMAIYKDGTAAHEKHYGSLRNAPMPHRIVRLQAGTWGIDIPHDADPIWLRRVRINVFTGEQEATVMIGWRRGEEAQMLWVRPDGWAEVTDHDPEG